MKGIDVSVYQGNIDWQAVKNSEVEFAILRVGYGREDYQKDETFEENYTGAKVVGMPIGIYHYSYALTPQEAIVEAETMLNWIKGKQFEYPIYFDIEEQSIANTGKANCTEIVKAFCSRLEKEGYFVGVYANTNWFKNYLDYAELSKLYSIWKADYRQDFDTSMACDIHQYTSDGSINGISARVDMNDCTRDFSFIKANGYNGFKQPTPQPAPIPKPNVIYQVYTNGNWLPEVTNYNDINSNGYAGVYGQAISGFRVRLSDGQTVYIQSHINGEKNWLSMVEKWDNTSDGYSGWKGKPTDCIAIKANGVKLKYRVHTLGGQWLSWVNTFNLADSINGFAGIYGKTIDAIQIGVE